MISGIFSYVYFLKCMFPEEKRKRRPRAGTLNLDHGIVPASAENNVGLTQHDCGKMTVGCGLEFLSWWGVKKGVGDAVMCVSSPSSWGVEQTDVMMRAGCTRLRADALQACDHEKRSYKTATGKHKKQQKANLIDTEWQQIGYKKWKMATVWYNIGTQTFKLTINIQK